MYKLRMHHMRNLVQYVQGGGVIEAHDDVPEDLRQQLCAEEEQQLSEQQKRPNHSTIGSMCPPININTLPAQSSPPCEQ